MLALEASYVTGAIAGRSMGLTYFKRFRMEIDLAARQIADVVAPQGYRLLAWHETLLEAHADVKFASFKAEIDANVFPCLGDLLGCHRLMHEIRNKEGFLPGATWLAIRDMASGPPEYCGTIQGIRDHLGLGAIQNLGVTPEHRNSGLGRALMTAALRGFEQAGLRKAFLEVTSQNEGAIRLYQRMGYVKSRTVYKAVEVAYS